MKYILLNLSLLLIFISCNKNISSDSDQYLYVWMHDVGFEDPNFLAVIDADDESSTYGNLLNTISVNETVGMAHHTPLFLPSSGMIFANDFHNSHTYVFDTSNPVKPIVINDFNKIEPYSFPHSYSELPNGNILTTFQTKEGLETVGGIVELDYKGKYLRASDAQPQEETIFMRPYGIVLIPDFNKIVTTNYDMHQTNIGYHIQIWDMDSLELLSTLKLPHVDGMINDQNPFEGRLLSDGSTVMFQTFSCGLFVLDGIETSNPTITKVFKFSDKPSCSVPVRLDNYWIQTVASDSGGFNGIVVLDITDPYNPVETYRLETGNDMGPHWLSPNASGEKIVLTGYFKELEKRVLMLDFDTKSGKLSIDERFGFGDENGAGFMLDREEWPHGGVGPAMAHGAIFWPSAPPDWSN
ncbi:MAG: hypothetical protein CBC65_009935 [Rhodothermaceae bacterium TMED105]|nr:MAG: hypothetical protein CBC65_009935 [Rhodothermaceae bacterium TMED105]